jgi:hypothetical protein
MISDEEVRRIFQGLLDTPGGYLAADPNWSRYNLQVFRGLPWQFDEGAHPGGCERHMDVFKKYNTIARYCFDCFKVEVHPRTIVELFKLLLLFERMEFPRDNTRKCFAELRPEISGAYKGVVYGRSLSEGRLLFRLVRDAVNEAISPNAKVVLKRGCSEHAAAYPRFSQVKPGVPLMDYRDYWKKNEIEFDRYYTFRMPEPALTTKGVYHPNEIYDMQFWMKYAATIGDESYLVISGKPLTPLPDLNRPSFVPSAVQEG